MRKSKLKFASTRVLDKLIIQYFEWIEGEHHIEQKEIKGILTDEKVCDRESEPPTIAGLAFHLGFCSLQQMEQYEATGKYAWLIQRGRLRIIAEYEKKLHTGPSSGAIFALKDLIGSHNKDEHKQSEATDINLKTEIITAGPPLASSEHDVKL